MYYREESNYMLSDGINGILGGTKALEEDINLKTKSLSRPYFRSALIKLCKENSINARLICDYILDEQTEINLKPATMEGKIKVLIWLSNFHSGKNFVEISKQDILRYLNNLRKPLDSDPTQRWIGSYNGRQAVFLKFFKWLHHRNEPDFRKRGIPECLLGIRKLNRFEKTPYKSSDIWNSVERALFLKYCPNMRDRCFHALVLDMSARPSEMLNLKIKDIRFFVTGEADSNTSPTPYTSTFPNWIWFIGVVFSSFSINSYFIIIEQSLHILKESSILII